MVTLLCRPQLMVLAGRSRISGRSPSIASAFPRISTPRGRHGGSTSSMTSAARPLRAMSRNFLERARLRPPISMSVPVSSRDQPTGTTCGMPLAPTVARRPSSRSPRR
ncbi:hypothetical protein H4W80_010508 [Nonomuraea angiospora]|uniref:Uncharacterized protein n=1 Tax=Nonomuraea angiospora TaxID=46172 RepID=A0ABR9MH59_9ACTN|nr:hypothetical protein [Nonomuraea angiospora]